MERDKRQMELRSEKVRNIIGQVPPALLRYGIAIIGLSLLVLLGVSAFIPYQPTNAPYQLVIVESTVSFPAKIVLKKRSALMWIVEKVKK